jgi:hypothetical protein
MRPLEEVQSVIDRLAQEIVYPGLSKDQRICIMGMVSALAWAKGSNRDNNPIVRLMNGEQIAPGQTVPDGN